MKSTGKRAHRERAAAKRERMPAVRTPGGTGSHRSAGTSHPRASRRVLSPRLVLAGVLALALYFAVLGGDYSAFEARQAEARLAARRAEIRAVRQESGTMRARIDSLRTSDEALERFVRERYGFIRDGEYLYRISDPEEAGEPGSVATEQSAPASSVVRGVRSGEGVSGAR